MSPSLQKVPAAEAHTTEENFTRRADTEHRTFSDDDDGDGDDDDDADYDDVDNNNNNNNSSNDLHVGFEFLTAVLMKSSVLWNIMPCSPLKVSQRLGRKSVEIQRTTRRYVPEHRTLNNLYTFSLNINSVRFFVYLPLISTVKWPATKEARLK
jgi:hypothetical protein